MAFLGNFELILFGFDNHYSEDVKFKENDKNFELDERLNTAYYDPKGKPLTIIQHATISNTFFPFSLPKNVSFTLLEGWTSKNVTIDYDGVSHNKDWTINGSFDAGEDPWIYDTSVPTKIIHDPWQPENVKLKVDNGITLSKGDFGYFEENVTITEPLSSNSIAKLSMDYFYSVAIGGMALPNIVAFISIDIGGISKNVSISFADLFKDGWIKMRLDYDLNLAGQQLPKNATIRAGVFVINDISMTGAREHFISIDNIQFEVWTKPNQPNLMLAKDVEFDQEYSYENITFGRGNSFIDVERSRTETSDIKFTISKNPLCTEELQIYNITITSKAFKIFNSTMNGLEGSEFVTNNQINWQTKCSFIIPYGYLNNWAEIIKPSDWNVTSIIDGYSIEKKGSCTGFDLGFETLIIPQNVLESGIWTIKAVSQNYISNGSLNVQIGATYAKESRITMGDTFQINATLNNTVSYQYTHMNCTIEFPNGSLYYRGDKELNSYDVEFGSFTVGKNMPVGSYNVVLLWTSNQSDLYRDKVGYLQFYFDVWHHTNLTAVDSYIEKVLGEPLLIKVKFTDYDLNTNIGFALITYNSTLGISGTMIYFGSGIYAIDIDTSGFEIGDYFFSFNASKSFYENQTVDNLIHLKVVPQPLSLEVPHYALEGNANSIISCMINVTGAISGLLLSPANISTDWFNSYNITNHNNKTYTLDFSTFNIPTSGHFESYDIEIFANKTNYGSTSDFITILVHPISTVANVNNSLVTINSNEIVNFKVNYTIEGSNELIIGSNCTVTWQGSSIISPVSDGFNIKLFTYGMPVDYYSALIKLNKAGFEDAFESVTIIIRTQNVNLNISINNQNIPENYLIEVSFNDLISISCRAFAETEGIYLSGGTVKFILDFHEIDLTESFYYWYNESLGISTNLFSLGINYVYIKFELSNYTTTTFSFQVLVNQIKINVKTIDFDNSINVYSGDRLTIWINLTESGSNIAINNATIYCYWEFGTYYFENTEYGLYKLDLDVSTNILGTHRFNLVVTPKEDIYKTTEYSFLIIISEKPLPDYVFWIVFIGLILVIGILGSFSLRSYVILPRRRKRELIIADKTQPFKDIRNIQAVLVSSRYSGISLYSKTFSILDENYITGFSGFIQAITILGNQYTKDGLKVVDIESSPEDTDERDREIKELDFNFFHSLICDYGDLRVVLLLRKRSSERLRGKINLLTKEIYLQNKDLINSFKGNIEPIKSRVEEVVYRHLDLYYKNPFELNKSKHYHSIKVSGTLSNLEIRILNVLEFKSKYKSQYFLEDITSLIDDINDDENIIAVESLISQKMIIPIR